MDAGSDLAETDLDRVVVADTELGQDREPDRAAAGVVEAAAEVVVAVGVAAAELVLLLLAVSTAARG